MAGPRHDKHSPRLEEQVVDLVRRAAPDVIESTVVKTRLGVGAMHMLGGLAAAGRIEKVRTGVYRWPSGAAR